MAVLALPLAGSLLAGSLFAWGTTAMSVGWMLGSWLYGAVSKSTTPGIKPNQMPGINQALRGTPVFVTFGTNRISSQIVWTKNWKPVRHGAGKSGGSGGGGGKGGGGGDTYEYLWDIMFHYGIVDTESYIKRGWNGGDAMTQATIEGILAGHNVAFGRLPGIFAGFQGTMAPPKASLDFTEAFFAPGFATGSAGLEVWSYFETQEGVGCAWPHTAYIGFKELNLGTAGIVPQLSFEIGPSSTLDQPSRYLGGRYDGTTCFTASNAYGLVDVDGKHWFLKDGMDSSGGLFVCVEDNTQWKIVTGVPALLTACAIPGLDTVSNFAKSVTVPIYGTNKFYVLTWNWLSASNQMVALRLIMNPDGTVSIDGYHAYANLNDQNDFSGDLQPYPVLPTLCGSAVIGGEVKLVMTQYSWTHALIYPPTVISIPITGTSVDFTPGTWEVQCLELRALGSEFLVGVSLPLYRMNRASILPRGTNGDYSVLFYKGIQDTGWNKGAWATEANPSLVWVDVTAGLAPLTYRVRNADFLMSAWDIGLNSVGAPGNDLIDDFSTPQCIEGRITWTRTYSDDPTLVRVISYLYDPVSDTILPDFDARLKFHDSIDPEPIANNDEFIVQTYIDPTTYDLVIAASYGAFVYFGLAPGAYVPTDVTPPYIIYRILTNTAWGFSVPTSRIDVASYADVVAECEAKGIKVSVTYTTADNFLAVMDELLSLYGGYLVDDAGIIRFGIVRSTDTPDPIVIDNTRLLSPGKGQAPVTVTKGAIQDGYNKVKFNYLDRDIDYKQNQVEVADEVDIDFNGPRVKEFPATYVMAGSLAQWEAERALWTNLYGRDVYNFKLGGKDAHRQPGDLITLVDSFHPLLRGGVKARIMKWKETRRLEFDVQAVAAIDYQMDTNHSFTSITSSDPGFSVSSIQPLLDFRMYELPQEFQGASGKFFVGYNQASAIMGSRLYLSVDSGASFAFTQDVQPFIVSGIVPALENRPNGWCERDVPFYIMPSSSGFDTTSPTFAQTYSIDDVTQAMRAAGSGVLYCGSEAMSWEGLTLLGQNHYRASRLYRGFGGTPISAHNSGEYFHAHGPGIFTQEITEDKIGTIFQYKVVPYNFAGIACDISSVAAKSYTIRGLYWLPRYQPRAHVFVQSAINWSRSDDIAYRDHLITTSGGCAVTLTWPAAANNEGYGAGGYGASGYGHFTSDILTPSYRVNVYSSNGSNVRSTVVYTGYFQYDLPTNSADFSGFARDLWFKVTPFNVKGDGPVADTRTLRLDW